MRIADPSKGMFPIGVVADMIGTSQKQLRVYESKGVIFPARSDGNRRLYSQRDVELLTFIHYLVSVEKVNLAGVRFILGLMRKFPKEDRRDLILSVEDTIRQLTKPEKEAFEEKIPKEEDDALLRSPKKGSIMLEGLESIDIDDSEEG